MEKKDRGNEKKEGIVENIVCVESEFLNFCFQY